MDALYINIASKLAKVKSGQNDDSGFSYIGRPSELKSLSYWRAVFAEFIATMFFVICGVASTVDLPADGAQLVKISLAFGFTIAALVQYIGHISGGHINPSVTLAMFVAGKMSLIKSVCYIIAQCAGGIVGAYVIKGITPESIRGGMGVTGIHPELAPGVAMVAEMIITFLLLGVIFSVTDANNPGFGSPAFAIGLYVATAHLAMIRYTGASMNPARSLGPAIAVNNFKDQWVYWAGPLIGAALSGLVYKYILSPYKSPPTNEEAARAMAADDDYLVVPFDFLSREANNLMQNKPSNMAISGGPGVFRMTDEKNGTSGIVNPAMEAESHRL